MSTIIKLSKPITVGDAEICELELREPTVDDVAELGYPYLVLQNDGNSAIELRPKVALKYASRLAAVPPSALKTITLGDLQEIQGAILGFFGG